MVVLTPVPVVLTPSGVRVKVHVPVLGKPFKTTLPVETVQFGGVTVPTKGALGTSGATLIVTLEVAKDTHPAALFTLNV